MTRPAEAPWVAIDRAWVRMSRIKVLLSWAPVLLAAVLIPPILNAPGWVLWLAVGAVLAIVAWRVWVQHRLWRAWGYAETADELMVRHGLLFRRMVVVPYGRMQSVDLVSGPLERRFGLARVKLVTASMGATAEVEGLRQDTARALVDRLGAQARERQWSL